MYGPALSPRIPPLPPLRFPTGMQICAPLWLGVWGLAICWLVPPARAQIPDKHWTLTELIDRALDHDAEVASSRWQVESATARRRQAAAAKFFPRLRLDSESGLVPDAMGNVFNPPADTTGIPSLGPFVRAELQFVQPLYPFSLGRHLDEAATRGVDVEQSELSQTRLDVAFAVKELYYGLLLAQDLSALAQRVSEELDRRVEELDDALALAPSDRYKLRLAQLDLGEQQRAVGDQLALARAALAWRTGLPRDAPLLLRAEGLAPVAASVPSLDELAAQALGQRPEWRKLQAGLAAKHALAQAARAAYQPQVFIGGGLRYAVAPGRTDQRNPFVKDEFNFFNGGVFIGVRQSLEWHLLAADLDRARAEYRALEVRVPGAEEGIRLDVHRAYLDYRRADRDLQGARQSRQLARQWLREARDDFEFDPQTIGELIAAFETWARREQGYGEALYDFNISVARLEKATGGLELIPRDETP